MAADRLTLLDTNFRKFPAFCTWDRRTWVDIHRVGVLNFDGVREHLERDHLNGVRERLWSASRGSRSSSRLKQRKVEKARLTVRYVKTR